MGVQSTPPKRLSEFVRGKRVALVGNADISGKGYGSAIEGHDLVVRFNLGVDLEDCSPDDYGRRMDVWAGCVIPRQRVDVVQRDGKKQRLHIIEFKQEPQQVWYVPFGSHGFKVDCPVADLTLMKEAAKEVLHGYRDKMQLPRDVRSEHAHSLDGRPEATTGFVVAYTLTLTQVSQVSLYGFDFFKTTSRLSQMSGAGHAPWAECQWLHAHGFIVPRV